MKPGTEADWFEDGGKYRWLHVEGGCEEAEAKAKTPRFRREYVIRECSRVECRYGPGVGFAGSPPPLCPACQSPWLIYEAAA